MSNGFEIGAAAMAMLEQMQEVSASNMGGNTPGAKKVGMAVEEVRFSDLMGGTISVPDGKGYRDFSPGKIERTGSATHIAISDIEGDVFFSLNKGEVYTRDGQFHWSEDTLVDKLGRAVEGDGGAITRVPGQGDTRFDADGYVYQGSKKIGQVAVYNVSDLQKLKTVPGGFELTDRNVLVEKAEEVSFVPEALEKSNNSGIVSMTDMTKLARSREAISKLIHAQDDSYGNAVKFATM